MRVLFTSLVNPQHLRPMVPLAWALRSAGHEVVVASAPNMTGAATAFGLSAIGFGDPIDPVGSMRKRRTAEVGRPGPERYRETGRRLGALAGRSVDELLAFAREWRPELVVHCPMDACGPVVAAALGVPSVLHRWGVDTFGPYTEGVAESLVDTYARLGVAPAADVVVDPAPASLQRTDVPRGLPMRYVPVNGAAVVPSWTLRPPRKPLVCVTFGNTNVSVGASPLVSAVLAALSGFDVVAAIRAEDRVLVGPADDVRIVESVPLELFLHRCSLLVHHGGSGSSFAAITAGCPQLVLPQTVDAFEYGDAIERQGSGHTVEAREDQQDPATLRSLVTKILGSRGHLDAAAELRAENAARPSPAQVADQLTM